jgi:hypothetical protein
MKRLHVACWHFVDISVLANVRSQKRSSIAGFPVE